MNELQKIPSAKECVLYGINKELKYFVVLVGLAFHPDTDFTDYTKIPSGLPVFRGKFAKNLNSRLDECHALCTRYGIDIYELSLNHIKPLL
jgi:hypothetical protein